MSPSLHIHLLGTFLVTQDDMPVTTLDMPRLQSLLAYLVLHSKAPQARSHLAFQLWPDSTESQAYTNLRTLVYRLRQALPAAAAFLSSDRHGLQWQYEAPWTLDVRAFEDALSRAEHAEQARDTTGTRVALAEAVELYQGDLLPACYEEWVLPERERLRQLFLKGLQQLIALLEHTRDYQAAIDAARHLLRYDPLHETTYRRLMRLYAVSGDRAAALRTYHTCTMMLERELMIEPDRATREIYEQLMQSREPTGTLHTKGITGPLGTAGTTGALPAQAPLVGREREWEQLRDAWRRTQMGKPHVVLLSGEAGVGKTRLAEELLTWVGRQGTATATAHCYATEDGLAYAPVAAWLHASALKTSLTRLTDVWLTEIARLVPSLLVERPELPRPGPLTEGWQRQYLFEALAQALLATPLLLFLDDLHWCDRETLAWLPHLLRFNPQARLLLVATMRPGEAEHQQALEQLLSTLHHEGRLTELALKPLDRDETIHLAEHLTGRKLHEILAQQLYQETEGNPLFLVETLRARMGYDGIEAVQQAMTPPTVQAVIATRLAQLSSLAHEIVSVAAVIGRAFPLPVLTHTFQTDEDALVQGLDELWQRRIIREQGGSNADAYDFSHDKLREGVYNTLSIARRRLLHRKVAEALEAVHAGALDAVCGQIASHYEQARLTRQAVSFYLRAGTVASQVFANAEAINLYRRAILLLAEAGPPDQAWIQWRQATLAQLYEQCGDVLDLTGQHEEARQAHSQALAYTPVYEHLQQARLHRKSGDTWHASAQPDEALRSYIKAENALACNAPDDEHETAWWQEWAKIQANRIQVHYWLAQMYELPELVEKMQPMIERATHPAQRAILYECLYLIFISHGRFIVTQETLTYAQHMLTARQETGQTSAIAWARYHLGCCYLWHDDLTQADEELQHALRIGTQTGDVLLQLRSLLFLALVYRKSNQVKAAYDHLLRAREAADQQQTPEHLASVLANLAWVAWRNGEYVKAQQLGQEVLEMWNGSSLVSPFQWMVLWPLIALALEHEQPAEAFVHAHALLASTQQPPPTALAAQLEAALQAWQNTHQEAALSLLRQALAIAREHHYL